METGWTSSSMTAYRRTTTSWSLPSPPSATSSGVPSWKRPMQSKTTCWTVPGSPLRLWLGTWLNHHVQDLNKHIERLWTYQCLPPKNLIPQNWGWGKAYFLGGICYSSRGLYLILSCWWLGFFDGCRWHVLKLLICGLPNGWFVGFFSMCVYIPIFIHAQDRYKNR